MGNYGKLINPEPMNRSWILAVGLLILIFLGSSTFGYALEIHHVFAEVDHDGHQHSDFDLCKWVQSHAANSLVCDDPTWRRDGCLVGLLFFFADSRVSSPVSFLHGSRGPPPSSMI